MNKKIVVGIIIALILILGLVVIYNFKQTSKESKNLNEYEKLIKRVDKKETFTIVLTNPSFKSISLDKTIDYYKETYKIELVKIDAKFDDKDFNKLLNKLSIEINENIMNGIMYIEKGQIKTSIQGDVREANLRKFLMDNKVIDSKYKDVDVLIGQDFDSSLKNSEKYCLLYIDPNDKELYKYRQKLVKNKIKSLVLYYMNLDSIKISTRINKELNIEYNNKDKKLPMIIKMKNNKILSSESVTVKDIVKKCK